MFQVIYIPEHKCIKKGMEWLVKGENIDTVLIRTVIVWSAGFVIFSLLRQFSAQK